MFRFNGYFGSIKAHLFAHQMTLLGCITVLSIQDYLYADAGMISILIITENSLI